MSQQGRLRSRFKRIRTTNAVVSFAVALVLTALAISPMLLAIQQPSHANSEHGLNGLKLSEPSNIRVRISWGGGTEQTWRGSAKVSNGTFSDVRPLGLQLDSPGSVLIAGGEKGDLQIQHEIPTNYGGADVTLTGVESEISLTLNSVENPELTFEKKVTFSELVSSMISGPIDQLGNRCSFVRIPGDQIDIGFQRDHLVFEPNETFEFAISPKRTGLATKNANAKIEVTSVSSGGRSNRVLSSQSTTFQIDENGSSSAQQMSIAVPGSEGVYEIDIEIEPAWFQSSFNSKKTAIKRTIQIVVLSRNPLGKSQSGNWRQVSQHDSVMPKQTGFGGWSQWSNLGRQPKPIIGNELRQTVVVENQEMLKLLPGGWQAIPITITRPNRPHVIELEYVAESEMALGLSLLEPDANGQIPLHGFDSGVFIPGSLVKSGLGEKVHRHRLTVWPKTQSPYLLVANRQPMTSVNVGSVNVFAGPERLEPSPASSSNDDTRKFMAFYELPLFADNFGARSAREGSGSEQLDDWQLFYEGADRMIQYLKANSYRGAFMTVACDGSSIYPSRLINASPKHDTGTFFSSGQDPMKKDVLELLFRMFEREGLELVPALSLSAPLPEVEQAILASAEEDGGPFKMLNLNQEPPSTRTGEKLPIYNPLSRKVQRSVTRVVDELAQRYKEYGSFNGIAMICRPDNYTLLPGRNWGYDPTTVSQFIQAQPDLHQMPSTVGGIRELLLGSHRDQWIQWRAQQMTRWYEDMAVTMKRSIPDGELYLAPVDLYLSEEMASAMSPTLHSSTDFNQVMRHMGFMPRLIKGLDRNGKDSGVVLLNTHRFAPDQTLARQRVDLEVRNAKQVTDYYSQSKFSADLFSHRISWAHFEQLQSQSPFGNQQNPLMRLQQMSPFEHFNRQRFADAIKDRDSRMLIDGGWLVTMGQESALLDMMDVFGQLPNEDFTDVASKRFENTKTLPLAVRELKRGNESWFYAVNASPWPMNVTLWVNANSKAGANIVSLSNAKFVVKPTMMQASTGEKNEGSMIQLTVAIEPFGLVGAKSDDAQTNVTDFDFEFPDDVEKSLRKHVYLLQSKLIRAENAPPIRVIDVPGFEVNGQPSLAGWDMSQFSARKIQLDPTTGAPDEDGKPGQISVSMTGDSQNAVWLRSNTFDAPETGRLSISVWLKTNDPGKQPPLRLSVEGQTESGGYYRFGSVGSLSPTPESNQITSQWKRFAVHFDDLPTEDMKQVRIGFDLMGPGQVNIDNVQIYDRWFDKNDAKAITQMLASAGPLMSSKESYDSCRRLLEGYWTSFLDYYISTEKEESPTSINNNLPPDQVSGAFESGLVPVVESDRQQKKVPMFRRLRNIVPSRNKR